MDISKELIDSWQRLYKTCMSVLAGPFIYVDSLAVAGTKSPKFCTGLQNTSVRQEQKLVQIEYFGTFCMTSTKSRW